MKKIIFLVLIFIVGSITFAENTKEEQSTVENTQQTELSKTQNTLSEKQAKDDSLKTPDYTSVAKGNQIFYYDKEGKFFARDKN